MNTTSKIGSVISELRKTKGVTQEELAKYVGVSAQAVSKWENGGVPDTELLPKIADYFEISIDSLFGRSMTDDKNLKSALIKNVYNTPDDQRFKVAFNYCWDIERALMPNNFVIDYQDSIEDNEKMFTEDEQQYSQILTNHGFTQMGIANRLQYFLIVPEIKDTDMAFFNGIDYPALFKDLSDKDVFDACILLNKRDSEKAFTPNLLVKHMSISFEKSEQILATLRKYRLVYTSQIEMDDEVQIVYHFYPSPAFIALLIFARAILDRPNNFTYNCSYRRKPYLK